MRIVEPKVYLVGFTDVAEAGLLEYLSDSGNLDFWDEYKAAVEGGTSPGEALCSFYAKLCYSALSLGRNDNITRTRAVPDNVRACFDRGHGSVFEHAGVNFVARNVSRVLTHELVRHRAGTAFSQTSGRYVRTGGFDFVWDGVLDPVAGAVTAALLDLERAYAAATDKLLAGVTDFAEKKRLTSALRRMLPNGMANEIGFTLNFRALRHTVMIRTSRHAEREIRRVFGGVYRLCAARFPLLFHGAVEEEVDGLLEVSGMRMQPYDPR